MIRGQTTPTGRHTRLKVWNSCGSLVVLVINCHTIIAVQTRERVGCTLKQWVRLPRGKRQALCGSGKPLRTASRTYFMIRLISRPSSRKHRNIAVVFFCVFVFLAIPVMHLITNVDAWQHRLMNVVCVYTIPVQ